MIVGARFDEDWDKALMYAQQSVYFEVIVEWVTRACEAYRAAEALIGTPTVLGQRISKFPWSLWFRRRHGLPLSGIDLVEAAHDLMAAWYRCMHGHPPLFTLLPDDRTTLESDWRQFAKREIGRLLEDPDITRLLLTAAAFGNAAVGLAAERELDLLLRKRYAGMFRSPVVEVEDEP